MSDDAKQALVRLLGQHEIPLIEDDIYGDLHHDGTRPRPPRAFDRQGLVMLCASFSKTLAPGHSGPLHAAGTIPRAGGAPQVSRRRSGRRRCRRWRSPTSWRTAVTSVTCAGCGALAEQVARTRAAISASFPAGTRLSRPRGGYVLWVEMPPGKNALSLHALA